jgi:hypothetical protein
MIRRYCDDAEAQAAIGGDELPVRGDRGGMLARYAIISAIRALQVENPAEDEACIEAATGVKMWERMWGITTSCQALVAESYA